MKVLTTAICLHALSSDLKFLNPVRNRIEKVLGAKAKVLQLTDHASHAEAKLALRQAHSGLVVIFAHGNGDYLRGGEYRNRAGDNLEVEKFFTRQDLSLLEGKVVFCMSCDSNGLAQASLEAGALAFVGFDAIPFNRFDEKDEPIGSYVLVKHCQELIAQAVVTAVERFLVGRGSLVESVDFLRMLIAQRAVAYVREMEGKGVKERKEIAALFLKVRTGLRYHGEQGISFVIDG